MQWPAPIHALLSGWQDAGIVATLESHGLVTFRYDAPPVPTWSSVTYRSTFSKLNVLRHSWAVRRRVLFLDNDVVAFRNIDHLLHAPTPAFVFHPIRLLASGGMINSGVMLLHVESRKALDATWQCRPRLTLP